MKKRIILLLCVFAVLTACIAAAGCVLDSSSSANVTSDETPDDIYSFSECDITVFKFSESGTHAIPT